MSLRTGSIKHNSSDDEKGQQYAGDVVNGDMAMLRVRWRITKPSKRLTKVLISVPWDGNELPSFF